MRYVRDFVVTDNFLTDVGTPDITIEGFWYQLGYLNELLDTFTPSQWASDVKTEPKELPTDYLRRDAFIISLEDSRLDTYFAVYVLYKVQGDSSFKLAFYTRREESQVYNYTRSLILFDIHYLMPRAEIILNVACFEHIHSPQSYSEMLSAPSESIGVEARELLRELKDLRETNILNFRELTDSVLGKTLLTDTGDVVIVGEDVPIDLTYVTNKMNTRNYDTQELNLAEVYYMANYRIHLSGDTVDELSLPDNEYALMINKLENDEGRALRALKLTNHFLRKITGLGIDSQTFLKSLGIMLGSDSSAVMSVPSVADSSGAMQIKFNPDGSVYGRKKIGESEGDEVWTDWSVKGNFPFPFKVLSTDILKCGINIESRHLAITNYTSKEGTSLGYKITSDTGDCIIGIKLSSLGALIPNKKIYVRLQSPTGYIETEEGTFPINGDIIIPVRITADTAITDIVEFSWKGFSTVNELYIKSIYYGDAIIKLDSDTDGSLGFKSYDAGYTYSLNEPTLYNGLLYRSRENNNRGNTPAGVTNSHWILVTGRTSPQLFSIPTTAWSEVTYLEEVYYKARLTHAETTITASDSADVLLDNTCRELAVDAELTMGLTVAGYVELYAKSIPLGILTGTLIIEKAEVI